MATPSTDPSKNKTFVLPDGRTLGYAEYGDPKGTPLLFFHPFPSSRLEAGPAEPLFTRRGIRLIALDRPGFGLSSPSPSRSVLDWAADIRAFADGTGLQRFAILGCSGGGPYALACAHSLPKHMLSGVGLFASAPHWSAGAHHMSLQARFVAWSAKRWPAGLKMVFATVALAVKLLSSMDWVTRKLGIWLEGEPMGPPTEAGEHEGASEVRKPQKLAEQQRAELLRAALREPFAQGVEATVQEAGLLFGPDWGFELEEVEFQPIRLWHGAQDTNAPISAIRWMAERIPGAVLTEFENETHHTMYPRFDGALEELIPKKDA